MEPLSCCACRALLLPVITRAFADIGFAGDGPANATTITVEIVRKPADQVPSSLEDSRSLAQSPAAC